MASYNNPPYAQGRGGAPSTGGANQYGGGQTGAAHQRQPSTEMPQLGATFVPGGFDDYFMPEVIAPSPQRVMPEVPQNMQKDLQRMELEAREVEPRRESDTVSPMTASTANQRSAHGREASLSNVLQQKPPPPIPQAEAKAPPVQQQQQQPPVPPKQPQSQPQPPPQPQQQPPGGFKPFHDNAPAKNNNANVGTFEAPSFSPFPKVKGDNIPPSDEEKEEILWSARHHVLHSNNISMQLSWARDTLIWVEISAEAYVRENRAQTGRAQTPKIEHELRIDAVNIISYLAEQEHPEALFMRSKWLEFGKFGYRVDKKEAYRGYTRAAEMNWGRAEYRMGMLYENSNDFGNAIARYTRGLELKDSAASYRIGMMRLLGQHGYAKDYQRGLDLIQAAADTSDEDAPQGAYVYGMIIAKDLPDISIPDGMLPYDVALARMYIEKAAYLGFSKAQLKMGQAYELCQLGCDFNPSYSVHYYGLAARQGQADAALGVSRWFLFGYDGYFGKNEHLAFKYAQQAADAKLANGEFAMGYYYEIGINVMKDLREARKWYEMAAEHGNKDAISRLESLNQSKTLTKADHETATLSRIKSQHGSQRGRRPDRLKKAEHMPTVSESATPPRSQSPAAAPPKAKPPKAATPSPKVSPAPSPRQQPTVVQDTVEFPDPSKPGAYSSRPPAFTINIDNQAAPNNNAMNNGLAMRPKSTAPYPEDDRPAPLNLTRPKSTAPYPEDDVVGARPLSPHFNPSIRPSQGPPADRPMSAFGIRPLSPSRQPGPGGRQPSPGPPQVRQSQSLANLVPPNGNDPRGRVPSGGWEPQMPAGGQQGAYRQPSPSPNRLQRQDQGRDDYRRDDYRQGGGPPLANDYRQGGGGGGGGGRPPFDLRDQRGGGDPRMSGGIPPAGTAPAPAPSKLTKQNPNPGLPRDNDRPRPREYANPAGYGPRTSSIQQQQQRPASENYDRYSSSNAFPPGQRPLPSQMASSGMRPDRVDSLPAGGQQQHARLPSGGGGSGVRPLKERPSQMQDGPQGRASAPPAPVQSGGPQYGAGGRQHGHARPGSGGSGSSSNTTQSAPAGKQQSQGPATFEEMGIPQGKGDDDCVVM